MRFCTSCGNKLYDTDLFCGECGQPVERLEELSAMESGLIAPAEELTKTDMEPVAEEKPVAQKPKTEKLPPETVIQQPKAEAVVAEEKPEKKKKSAALWIVLAAVLVLAVMAVVFVPKFLSSGEPEYDYYGTCGEQLQWGLNYDEGELIIYGTGEMEAYTDVAGSRAPWYAYYKVIRSVTVSEGVSSVSKHAFFGLEALEQAQIADTVTSMGDCCFFACYELKELTIPASVESIGIMPFVDCMSLEKIEVDSANAHYADVDGVLFDKDMTLLITVPAASSFTEYTVPETVTTIADFAFGVCMGLEKITLPRSVITLGYGAFCNCTGLQSFTIPDGITTLPMNLFAACSALKEVNIPKSVTVIERGVFASSGLTTVNYADSWANWEGIQIDENNDALTSATVNTVEPKTSGRGVGSSYTINGEEYVVVPGRDGGVRVVHIRP